MESINKSRNNSFFTFSQQNNNRSNSISMENSVLAPKSTANLSFESRFSLDRAMNLISQPFKKRIIESNPYQLNSVEEKVSLGKIYKSCFINKKLKQENKEYE